MTQPAEAVRPETPEPTPSGARPIVREPRARGFFAIRLLDDQYPALHGLRFLAIVSVLQVHVTVALVQAGVVRSPGFARLSTTAWFGMDCFFVMSGFLIGGILFRARARSEGLKIGRFYLRRAFRTFPLYYTCLLGYAALAPLSPAQRESLGWELAYLTNYAPHLPVAVFPWGWSLSVEEHFYFAIPALVGALSLVRSHAARISILCVLWGSALVLRLWIFAAGAGRWTDDTMMKHLYVPTHVRFDPLVAGLFVAYLVHARGDALRAWLAKPWARRLLLTIAAVSFVFLMSPDVVGSVYLWNVLSWGTVTSTFYVPVLLYLVAVESGARSALGGPRVRRVSTLSYGVYLLHMVILEHALAPVARAVAAHGAPAIVVWPATLLALVASSVGAAYVLHLVVEKPSLWLRDRVGA